MALKPKSESKGTQNQPEFLVHQTLFKYVRNYRHWVKAESLAEIPRQYTNMEHAANIRKQIEKHDRYAIPAAWLKYEMHEVETKKKKFLRPRN